jgi:hypothetical protein
MSDILVSCLLDRSGSMHNIWTDTLGGLESFKQDQLKENGKTWFSLYGFDSGIRTGVKKYPSAFNTNTWPSPQGTDWFSEVYEVWDAKDVTDITKLTSISPRGQTPLLDAIAEIVERTELALNSRPWFDGKVILVIQTDGYENSSHKNNKSQIKDLIGKKENEGWQIVFMGAGIDAVAEGQEMGLTRGTSFGYANTAAGTAGAYNTLSRSVSNLRTSEAKRTEDFWQEPESNEDSSIDDASVDTDSKV